MAAPKGTKQRRTGRDKPWYNNYRARYSGVLIRRRGKREKRLEFFAINPTAGSPSQVIMRRRVANRKLRKKRKVIL